MRLDVENIIDGSMRGQIVYACDYRKPDMNKKAIRNVSPEKCVIYTEQDFEDAGRKWPNVYYSVTVLLPLNKKDEPIWSRPIKVFDNTGYRSYTGVPIEFFDNMEECVEAYNTAVQEVVDRYQQAILAAPLALINEQAEIKKLLIEVKK